MDLYRLVSEDDFFEAGLEEYIYSGGVSVIEWADKFSGLIDRCSLVVRFSSPGEGRRRITIEDRRAAAG
jgi:tRNA threonylcarbamoyladenosine biosynthesis protein TsaE